MMTRRRTLLFILFSIMASGSVLVPVSLRICRSGPGEYSDPAYRHFAQLAAEGRTTEALALGDSLFTTLHQENPGDSALALLARRLDTIGQIQALVADRAQPNPVALAEGMAGMDNLGLPIPAVRDRNSRELLLPPARVVYWTSLGTFTAELSSACVTEQQMAFCRQYYELRVRESALEIARQILITNPDSSEHMCHVLVLPLLLLHGRDDAWDRMAPLLALIPPEMLDTLSRFALLQAERPEAAMALARHRAGAMGTEFSPPTWACDAANVCVAEHRPDLAENMIRSVIRDVTDPDLAAELYLKIADTYARCGDSAAAAQVCDRMIAGLPDTALYGRTVVAHLGYLAKDDDADEVIARAASALDDPRCSSHLGQILYLQWWAFRKADRLEEAAQTARRLLEQYRDNPCIAPVLLERATDALARQEYETCRELLTRLTRDFAGTEPAKRALDILARLQNSNM